MKKNLHIFISNMSEDVWPFISSMENEHAKAFEIEENANLADQHLFSCADINSDLIFISPKKIDPVLEKYFQNLSEIDNFKTLYPDAHTGKTSIDAIQDKHLINNIVQTAKDYERIVLFSYSSTAELYLFKEKLEEHGIEVFLPEAPEQEDFWTVNFFGSKSGFRQLAQKSIAQEPNFIIPDGVVVSGIREAAQIAASKYIDEDGVVLKTNKGHSGAGVLIFRENELPKDYKECTLKILEALGKDKYWNIFPIIIESLVNINQALAGGFPNVEFRVKKSGEVELLYICGLRVDSKGVFKGQEISDTIMSARSLALVVDMGYFIGEQYRKAGYRGLYDVDMIAGKNGKIYVSESNTRRTGGTHVYRLALEFFGKDFMHDTYVLNENNYKFSANVSIDFKTLLEIMKPVAYSKITKTGAVFFNSNILNQKGLGYAIFAKDKSKAQQIEIKMKDIINNYKS